MNTFTHHTAPIEFIEADDVRYAYRRFGKKEGLPLVFIPDIIGNMDSRDPSITDGFAQSREVIFFNNAGIASSSGEVPVTFAEMAKSAGVFIDAFGLTKVDVLGFSIGSMIAQNVAMERPDLVRKLVIVGSGPRNGDGIPLNPESQAIFSNKYGIPMTSGLTASSRRRRRVRLLAVRFLSGGMRGWSIAILPSATRFSQLSSLLSRSGATPWRNVSPI